MSSQTDFVQPPRIAVWLVTLFIPAEEAESILGDLLEEFSHLASKSGVAFARSWYWRQTVRTIAHFVGTGFRVAPWSTAAAVVGGYLLIRFGSTLPKQAVEALLDRYRVYEYDAAAYVFWIKHAMLIGRVIVAAMAGGFVAMAAKGREMTSTMMLGLIMSALGVTAFLMVVARTADYGFLSTLPWVFASPIAIVVGGAIV